MGVPLHHGGSHLVHSTCHSTMLKISDQGQDNSPQKNLQKLRAITISGKRNFNP